MIKKIGAIVTLILLVINLYGCAPILVGAAGGAGATAAWQNRKLTRVESVTLEEAKEASLAALEELKLPVNRKSIEKDYIQIKSKYNKEKTIWIDLHHVSDEATKIEVRVGMLGDENASSDILNQILENL